MWKVSKDEDSAHSDMDLHSGRTRAELAKASNNDLEQVCTWFRKQCALLHGCMNKEQMLHNNSQVLCITNTRSQAKVNRSSASENPGTLDSHPAKTNICKQMQTDRTTFRVLKRLLGVGWSKIDNSRDQQSRLSVC